MALVRGLGWSAAAAARRAAPGRGEGGSWASRSRHAMVRERAASPLAWGRARAQEPREEMQPRPDRVGHGGGPRGGAPVSAVRGHWQCFWLRSDMYSMAFQTGTSWGSWTGRV